MLTVSDLELYPGFVMQEKEHVKIKTAILSRKKLYWIGGLIACGLPFFASFAGHFSDCEVLGLFLIIPGCMIWTSVICGIISLRRGGWIPLITVFIQWSTFWYINKFPIIIIVDLLAMIPGIWLYYKHICKLNNLAITALHLLWLGTLSGVSFIVGSEWMWNK